MPLIKRDRVCAIYVVFSVLVPSSEEAWLLGRDVHILWRLVMLRVPQSVGLLTVRLARRLRRAILSKGARLVSAGSVMLLLLRALIRIFIFDHGSL